MIKLYYSPFSCSTAIHIILELIKADYEAIRVQIWSDEFKKIAPKWAVPAIIDSDDGEVMTQIVAIINYLLQKYPNSNLWSDNSIKSIYLFNNVLSFLNSDLHTSFWSAFWSKSFTTKQDEDSIKAIKEASFIRIEKQLWYLDNMLNDKNYLLFDRLTVADIYAFVIYNWANMILPTKLEKFENINRHLLNISNIPEVKKVLEIHSK